SRGLGDVYKRQLVNLFLIPFYPFLSYLEVILLILETYTLPLVALNTRSRMGILLIFSFCLCSISQTQ
ncbi:hypothetical protein KQJ29_32295, partial [Enterococcus sp. S181_ASV_20]|nr:hypothetical protein [Enterococcus sp. S181_ASV_20]